MERKNWSKQFYAIWTVLLVSVSFLAFLKDSFAFATTYPDTYYATVSGTNSGLTVTLKCTPHSNLPFGTACFWNAPAGATMTYPNSAIKSEVKIVFPDYGTRTVTGYVSSGGSQFSVSVTAERLDYSNWGGGGGFWDTQKWVNGDFNGDGKADLANVFNSSGSAHVDVHLSNGSGFSPYASWGALGPFLDSDVWLAGDFNGDGYGDLARIFKVGTMVSIDIHQSNYGQNKLQSFTTVHAVQQQGTFYSGQKWFVGDFDANKDNSGHPRDDIAVIFGEGGEASIDVYRSYGLTNEPAKTYFLIRESWAYKHGGYWDAQKWMVGDFDGDEKADLVNVFDAGGVAHIDVHKSNGWQFPAKTSWTTSNDGGFWNAQKWMAGDFDGDGKTDLANVFNVNGVAHVDVHVSNGVNGFPYLSWGGQQGGFWDAEKWMAGKFRGTKSASGKPIFDLVNVFNGGDGTAHTDVHWKP